MGMFVLECENKRNESSPFTSEGESEIFCENEWLENKG